MTEAFELDDVEVRFMKQWPRIKRYIKIAFSDQRGERKEDSMQKAAEIVWRDYCRQIEKGKNPDEFISELVKRARQQVHAGRDITGQERAKDPLSVNCRRIHGVCVEPLPEYSIMMGNEVTSGLADKHGTPAEIVPLKLDFEEYLAEKKPKDQAMINDMVCGYTTPELAEKNGVTPGAISQRRRRYREELEERFQGDCVTR